MLNRHGTRLEIGLEDMIELELAEANMLKQQQFRGSGVSTAAPPRLSSSNTFSSPTHAARPSATTASTGGGSSGGHHQQLYHSHAAVSASPLFPGGAESPSAAAAPAGSLYGGGRRRGDVVAPASWEPRATVSSWDSERVSRRSAAEMSMESGGGSRGPSYNVHHGRNPSFTDDEEPRPSRASGVLPPR